MTEPLHPDMVRSAIEQERMSKSELAKVAGINKNSLTGVNRENWNPSWDTLQKLCGAAARIRRARSAVKEIMHGAN